MDLATGQILLEDKNTIFEAPNGNGGLFKGLVDSGTLMEMRQSGIEYIHVVGVDNVLLRLADPVQVGYAVRERLQVVGKFVRKAYAHEKVGVFCLRNQKFDVVEYSDIAPDVRDATNRDGLVLN